MPTDLPTFKCRGLEGEYVMSQELWDHGTDEILIDYIQEIGGAVKVRWCPRPTCDELEVGARPAWRTSVMPKV